MNTLVTALIVNLLVLSTTAAEIYKWTDSSGQVHYSSQCPFKSCESVKSTPVTSYSPVPLPDTSIQHSADKEPIPEPLPAKISTAALGLIIKSGECLDSIADTLGEGQIDPYEPIASIKPGAEQYRMIKHFLTRLPGLWHGTIKETTCKGSLKTPVNELITYRVDLDILHDLKGNYDFKTLERGQNNIVRQNNVKILITKDKFHAGESRSLITSKRWAVALLSVSANNLVLLQQFRTQGPSGGSLQRMILRSFHYAQKKLNMTEYEYTQDQLVRIKETTVK